MHDMVRTRLDYRPETRVLGTDYFMFRAAVTVSIGITFPRGVGGFAVVVSALCLRKRILDRFLGEFHDPVSKADFRILFQIWSQLAIPRPISELF